MQPLIQRIGNVSVFICEIAIGESVFKVRSGLWKINTRSMEYYFRYVVTRIEHLCIDRMKKVYFTMC